VTRFVRRSALPAGAALVVALVAGCSTGPAKPGAAAIVGGTTISVDALQAQLEGLAAARPQASRQALQAGKLPQTSRELLSYKVRGALLKDVRSRRHLSVPASRLKKEVAQIEKRIGGASLAPAERAQARSVVTDRLYQRALAKDVLGRLSMKVDLFFPSGNRARVVATARKLARNPSARSRRSDQGNGVHADFLAAGLAQHQPGLLPLLGAPDHSVVVFPVRAAAAPGNTLWVVGYVRARKLGKAAPGSARLIRETDPQVLEKAGRLLLAPSARRLVVTVNPRYGRFDPVSVSVVASQSDAYGLELPAEPATS
jgi:hypothetical protein